jgi:hypothetical protein
MSRVNTPAVEKVAEDYESLLAPFQTAEGIMTFPVTAHVVAANKA